MVRILACLVVLTLPWTGLAQGKLDRVREAVDRPREASDTGSADDAAVEPGVKCDDDDDDDSGFGEVLLFAAISPWMLPHAALDPGPKVKAGFTPYPYALSDTGHILLNRLGRPDFFDETPTKWYTGRASVEIGSNFDGLTRTGLRLFLDSDTRFGIKTDWDYYRERLPGGRRDDLWLGDVTATFRFVQHEVMQMHTGLGGRLLLDHGRDRGGFNFLYGFDAFPVKPLHLFGSFEAGTLGDAMLMRLHGGAGVSWTHGELFIGYDFLRIGDARLQGPFLGLRLWF